jgi:hypothetical protein
VVTASLRVVGRKGVSIVRRLGLSMGGDIRACPGPKRVTYPGSERSRLHRRSSAMEVARQFRLGTVGHHGPRTDFSIGFEPVSGRSVRLLSQPGSRYMPFRWSEKNASRTSVALCEQRFEWLADCRRSQFRTPRPVLSREGTRSSTCLTARASPTMPNVTA